MNLLKRLPKRRALPGVLSEADGFVDIDLPLTDIAGTETCSSYGCEGRIGESTIGLGVCLDVDWQEQQLEGADATVFWGRGAIRSLGKRSDSLIALLAVKYGNNSFAERPMRQRTEAQIVCLSGNPTALPRENLKMKFFFYAEDENLYAEVFVNLNFDTAIAQLHEKDPEYRLSLLRSLTEA